MIVFREEEPGVYDLWIDGRIADYELYPRDFADSLRRRRVDPSTPVFVEDTTGRKEPLSRR